MKISDSVERKFIEEFDVNDFEVFTNTGWKDISHSNKTVSYKVYKIKTSSGRELRCADTHILIDENYNEVFAKDSFGKMIVTESGVEEIVEVLSTNVHENMYDLSVDSKDHLYFTNGFLSHNSVKIGSYILHKIIFTNGASWGIAANKRELAVEVLDKIKQMYMRLPIWMQHGIKTWNVTKIILDNDSKILTSATNGDSFRGFTFAGEGSGVMVDECVSYDTIVTIRNTETGEIEDVKIGDLYERFKMFEILTPSGFQKFDSIKKTTRFDAIVIVFDNGKKLDCTPEHLILTNDNIWIKAKDSLNQFIQTDSGISKVICIKESQNIDFYDAINVENGHQYYTNGIVSHNCAFIHKNKWQAFEDSIMPTISSDPNSQIIMCSTPKGLNHWYDMFTKSKLGKSEFANMQWDYTELPQAKDPDWKNNLIKTHGPVHFMQNFGCEFLGSSNTLIEPSYLVALTDSLQNVKPIAFDEHSFVYEKPIKGAQYVATVDVSKGKGLDYHVIQVVKIEAEGFFKQVAVYRNNQISNFALPGIINKIGKEYNNAIVLIEQNNGGDSVCRDLINDFYYDNVIRIKKHKKTKEPTPSLYSGEYGLYQTSKTKRKGTSNLKLLIETGKLELNDHNTVDELKRFVADANGNYSADAGHDDCVMGLVLFAWLIFEYNEFHDAEFRKEIKETLERELVENTAPFVFYDNGVDFIQPGVAQNVYHF